MRGMLSALRRCLLPLMLLLSFMPLFLLALCTSAPASLGASSVLFAAYALACALCLRLPGKRRLPGAALSCAALMALGFAVLPVRAQPLLLLLPGALAALLLISLPLAARQSISEIHPFFLFIGVGVHLLAQFFTRYFSTNGVSFYAPVAPALTASLIGYMLLFLLTMNRISLDNATFLRHRLPPGMRMMNTLLTLGFLALSLIVALLPAVARALAALWQGLTAAVVRVCVFLLSLLPAGEEIGTGGESGAPQALMAEDVIAPASPLAQLLEKVASVFAMALLAACFITLLRILWRQLIRLSRHLARRLREYAKDAGAEYEDEITDTREDGMQRETRRIHPRLRRSPPRDAAPAARIRFAYAQMLRRHPEWARSATARETLQPDAAALYERARYSAHPVTDEDAQRFAREAKPSAPRTRGE